MNLRETTHGDPVAEGYRTLYVSTDDLWFIGLKPVMFGVRVIAWHAGSAGPVVDYCAGDDPAFLADLLAAITEIFRRQIPDGASERQVMALMPGWQQRPINRDPCWQELKALAAADPITA